MKIRRGLVSNSSSSSFLLFFNEVPKNKEELKEVLFPDQEFYENPYRFDDEDPENWPSIEIAEKIFNEIQKTEELSRGEAIGIMDNYMDLPSRSLPLDLVERCFKGEYGESHVFHLLYSDKDSLLNAVIESGKAFNNIPYFKISLH
jgi:hypothetical protein